MRYVGVGLNGKFGQSQTAVLAIGHFLRHVKKKFAIVIISFAHQTAKLGEITSVLAGAAPSDLIVSMAGTVWPFSTREI